MYRNKKYKGAADNVRRTTRNKPEQQPGPSQSVSQQFPSSLRSIDENKILKISNHQAHEHEINAAPKKKVRLAEINVDNNMQIDDDDDDNLLASQSSIPSSQPATQRRYLSQRGSLLAGLTRTQSISFSSGKNYFEVVLIKVGVDLNEPDTYVLSCDHVTFVNNLRSILKKNTDFPENLVQFLDGFKEALQDPKTKLKLLTCCTIKISNNTNETSYLSQDSLIVNFLMIEFIQKEVLTILFDEIKICSTNEKVANFQSIPLLPLYLSQLKFVANIHGQILYDNVMDIYKVSTIEAQNTICDNVEFIFEASKHDEFVKYLIANTTSNKELLSKSKMKAFTNLYLSKTIERQLSLKILIYMKNNHNVQDFPHLVQFLVKIKNEDENLLKEQIADLILALDKVEINLNNKNDVEDLRKIFTYLKQGLIKSKKLFDICLKHIQNQPEVKAIDFVIFMFLISIREDKCSSIENFIRRQVKLERLIVNVISEAKKKYLPILDSICGTLLHMLNDFLKDKSLLVADYAKDSLSIIFGIGDSFQKQILCKLVDLACNRSSTNQKVAVDTLALINNGYSKEIQNYGILLLPMLDQINEIDLRQTRTILQLICSIAYPILQSADESVNNLQDHIDMLVKKQVVNRSTFIKKQGIIGTVQVIDSIARTEKIIDDNQDNIYDIPEIVSVNNIPEGNGRAAGFYITKILSSCNYCEETLGLFYDELANAFSYKNPKNKVAAIDRYFSTWITSIITNYFESNFTAELDDMLKLEEAYGIGLKFDNCLNTEEEVTNSTAGVLEVYINLTGPVFQPSAEAHFSPNTLASLFNLTVKLNKICENNRAVLIAVPGMGLILPKCFGDKDIFDEYDEDVSKKILDIHFHAINWYRTVVNNYVGERDDENIRYKVIQRINNLIETEQIVREIIKKAPVNYVPPLCDYINSHLNTMTIHPQPGKSKPSTSKSNKQSQAEKSNINTEAMSILAQTQNTNNQAIKINKLKSNVKSKFDIIYGPKEIYRQIDADIILILDEKIKLNCEQNSSSELYLGLSEFQFVMTDLVAKIESIDGVKNIIPNHSFQEIVYLRDFLEKCGIYIPKILMALNEIQYEINSKLEEINSELGHVDLFADRMNFLKVTMSLCFRFLTAFYSYSGFIDNSEYQTIFKKSLQSISGLSSSNLVELSSAVIDMMLLYEKNMIDLKSAVYLFHLIKILFKFSNKEIHNKKIRELCKNLLCRKWYNSEGQIEKGALCNVLLDYIIQGFFKDSNFKRISKISKTIVEECSFLKKSDGFLISFPNIHKANFPMLYKKLGETLLISINEKLATKSSDISILKLWEENCEILDSLLCIVKQLEIPRNFSLYLKYAHQFIKIFLLNGLPVLERSLRIDPELCNNLLKNLQNNTRYLHNLCCHSKKNKNTAIIIQIPLLRETIETLLIKVKAALVANKVGSAFWMGNLKNKDIHGEEIVTQESLDQNEEHNSDGEIPGDDDESVDETICSESEENTKSAAVKKLNSRSRCF